jgi:adenylate kinase
MDAGDLVPNSVITGVILERIAEDDARDGFLLDGFPRTIEQADSLGEALEASERRLTGVLLIDTPDDVVVKRISGRRVNVATGRTYHVDFDPPKQEGRCDVDGSELVQRDDDREETVRKRLVVYHEQTEPLIGYYDNLGLLRRFDGTRSASEVHAHIRATISTLRLEDEL